MVCRGDVVSLGVITGAWISLNSGPIHDDGEEWTTAPLEYLFVFWRGGCLIYLVPYVAGGATSWGQWRGANLRFYPLLVPGNPGLVQGNWSCSNRHLHPREGDDNGAVRPFPVVCRCRACGISNPDTCARLCAPSFLAAVPCAARADLSKPCNVTRWGERSASCAPVPASFPAAC